MATGLGEAAAIITIIEAAKGVASVTNDVFSFRSDCRRLRDGCNALSAIVLQNQEVLKGDATIEELANALQKCYKYIGECKRHKFFRNPVFEVTFNRRIDKYSGICNDWILKAILSSQVGATLLLAKRL
jgi:hypothetical protein